MFILRRVTSRGIEMCFCLGEDYNLTTVEANAEEFCRHMNLWTGGGVADKEIYGFIAYNQGKAIQPLYVKSKYFIKLSNGDVFADISYK